MPITHQIDVGGGVIITTVEGRVTEEDMRAQPQAMYDHPDFSATYHRLVDLRNCTEFAIPGQAVLALARRTESSKGTRRAFVVSRDASYGLARMYQMLRDGASEDNQVFRDIVEARTWLGLD